MENPLKKQKLFAIVAAVVLIPAAAFAAWFFLLHPSGSSTPLTPISEDELVKLDVRVGRYTTGLDDYDPALVDDLRSAIASF